MMRTVKYVYWQEGGLWIGYLQDYPDYWTQGETSFASVPTRGAYPGTLAANKSTGRQNEQNKQNAITSCLAPLRSLPEPPAVFIQPRLTRDGIESLPIEHRHACRVAQLPDHHRDPFDRLLVAVAQLESLRVRHALQMAIDLETANGNYFSVCLLCHGIPNTARTVKPEYGGIIGSGPTTRRVPSEYFSSSFQ